MFRLKFVYKCKHVLYIKQEDIATIYDLYGHVENGKQVCTHIQLKPEFIEWREKNIEPVRIISKDINYMGIIVGFKTKEQAMKFKMVWG